MDAIVVKNLTKIFVTKERKGFLKKSVKKRIVAVDHISFNVRRGEVFGLLGPNGAGKTTTIKMLSTLLIPDEGDAWVNGYHVVREANKVRESIGVSLYSDRGFYWKLTGRENLRY
ncbi:MAG: ABC transporter ATP-binding protein, partial [Thermoprotei archaeon]